MNFFSHIKRLPIALAGTLVLSQGHAMVALEEEEMSGVSGAGLAFVMDNFSMRMAPTSYAEITGRTPTLQAQGKGWQRGDARYYGLSFTSGASAGTDWFGNGCGDGSDALKCPLGGNGANFGVAGFASAFDPFVLRVFQNPGFDYQGAWRGPSTPVGFAGTVLPMPTVLEFVGPRNTDVWRWAFWGELEVGRGSPAEQIGTCNAADPACGAAGADFLQSQTIIHGRPVARGLVWGGVSASGVDQGYTESLDGNKPAILRLMQTANTADPTLGITYQSALSGDFRFSVRQLGTSSDTLHAVPDFNNEEGLHFRNVDAFLPLGTLHYQGITFSGVSSYNADTSPRSTPVQNGNFSIELTRIPNNPNIYNHFYCGSPNGSACQLDTRDFVASPNPDTHGYVRWGNWCVDATCTGVINPYTAALGEEEYNLPNGTSVANGIYFVGTPNLATNNNAVVNLGISRVEGLAIQHLKITTLGAGI